MVLTRGALEWNSDILKCMRFLLLPVHFASIMQCWKNSRNSLCKLKISFTLFRKALTATRQNKQQTTCKQMLRFYRLRFSWCSYTEYTIILFTNIIHKRGKLKMFRGFMEFSIVWYFEKNIAFRKIDDVQFLTLAFPIRLNWVRECVPHHLNWPSFKSCALFRTPDGRQISKVQPL